jgi:hypothetical protein
LGHPDLLPSQATVGFDQRLENYKFLKGDDVCLAYFWLEMERMMELCKWFWEVGEVYPLDGGEQLAKVVLTFLLALLIAANNEYLDVEDQGGLFQGTLQAAALSANLETVKAILNHFVQFAKPHTMCYFRWGHFTDMHPFNDAASTGSLEAVKLLPDFVPSDITDGPNVADNSSRYCFLQTTRVYAPCYLHGIFEKMHALRTAINSNHTAMIELITDNLAKT